VRSCRPVNDLRLAKLSARSILLYVRVAVPPRFGINLHATCALLPAVADLRHADSPLSPGLPAMAGASRPLYPGVPALGAESIQKISPRRSPRTRREEFRRFPTTPTGKKSKRKPLPAPRPRKPRSTLLILRFLTFLGHSINVDRPRSRRSTAGFQPVSSDEPDVLTAEDAESAVGRILSATARAPPPLHYLKFTIHCF
jgi:hypothetical protein